MLRAVARTFSTSNAKPGHERALVLSVDGACIQMLFRAPESDEIKESEWKESSPFRALFGRGGKRGLRECRRLLFLPLGSKSSLRLVGTRPRDAHSCVVVGEYGNLEECDRDSWTSVIPSIKTKAVWLDPQETVQALVCLPRYQHGRRLVAASTGKRVLLLLPSMKILARVSAKLSCSQQQQHDILYKTLHLNLTNSGKSLTCPLYLSLEHLPRSRDWGAQGPWCRLCLLPRSSSISSHMAFCTRHYI